MLARSLPASMWVDIEPPGRSLAERRVPPDVPASRGRSFEVRLETPSIDTAEAVLFVPLEGVDDLSGHALGVLFGEEEDERDDVLGNDAEGRPANARALPDESTLLLLFVRAGAARVPWQDDVRRDVVWLELVCEIQCHGREGRLRGLIRHLSAFGTGGCVAE